MSNNKGKINFRYILNKLVGFDYTSSSGTKSYLYIRNILGDITSIIDSEGNIICSYIYDGFGNHIVLNQENKVDLELNSIGHINPFRYRGYYYDEETGLYYLNSRYYDPSTCRFISPDNIEYLDPNSINGLNLYTYCGNNPIMYADPSGHMPKWLAWLISGFEIISGIVLCATGIGGILGGILLGAGAGSLINGYINEANGGSFTAGYIGGMISGALCGLGAGIGGSLFLAATETANFASIGLIASSILTSFAGGFTGNFVGSIVSSKIDKKKVDYERLTYDSIFMGMLNILSGMMSGVSSLTANIGKIELDLNSKIALRLFSAILSSSTEMSYDLISWIYGKIMNN